MLYNIFFHLHEKGVAARLRVYTLLYIIKGMVLLDNVEAGAVGFAGVEVGVGYNQGLGVTAVQILQEMKERRALCGRAGVLGLAVWPQASDVADSDGVLVVVAAMCAHCLDGSPILDGAVGGDDIVISAAIPTA